MFYYDPSSLKFRISMKMKKKLNGKWTLSERKLNAPSTNAERSVNGDRNRSEECKKACRRWTRSERTVNARWASTKMGQYLIIIKYIITVQGPLLQHSKKLRTLKKKIQKKIKSKKNKNQKSETHAAWMQNLRTEALWIGSLIARLLYNC